MVMNESGNDLIFTGERFVPGIDDYKLEMEHIQRYRMAQKFTKDKIVIDAACGEGYGSALLAANAKQVIGVDISEEIISHAKYRYADKINLTFQTKNVADLVGIEDQSADVVVSFETIEHVSEDVQRKFLGEIKRVLKPDGLLLMSTPNKEIYSDMFHYHNEYHIHEFSKQSFTDFLHIHFKNVRLLGQSFEVDCVISDPDRSGETAAYVTGNKDPLETCKYFIALASDEDISSENLNSVCLGNYGEYSERVLRLLELQRAEEKRNAHIGKLDRELDEKGRYIRELQGELAKKEQLWNLRIDEAHASLQLLSGQFSKEMAELLEERDDNNYRRIEAEKKADHAAEALQVLNEEIKQRRSEIASYSDIVKERDEEIEKLRIKITEYTDALNLKEEECTGIQNTLNNLNAVSLELRGELDAQKQKYAELVNENEKQKNEFESQIIAYEEKIQKSAGEFEKRIEELNREQEELLRQTKEHYEFCLELLRISESGAEEENKKKAAYISELEEKLDREGGVQQEQKNKLEQREAELHELATKLRTLSDMYEDKQKELRQLIRNRDGHIEQLLEKEREFNRIQTTRSYKFGQKIHRISEVLLPGGSTRRFVFGTVLKIVCHPVKMFRFLNPHRIKKFFWLVKMGGMDAVQYRFRQLEANELVDHTQNDDSVSFEVTRIADSEHSITDYDVIEFEQYAIPEVSIIIPVYNQFAYTYECLKSIYKNTEGVSYEVVIADDNSSDLTQEICRVVKNIAIVKNGGERGFLPNCNNAAKYAQGKYLLFLNNDTQVQSGWLKPMTDLLNNDESIGMTGAKLVYANGLLQEAGGILWKDGSAWNYGNQKSPDDPEYNYVREVDYISGAAIMIRHDLWQKIGGFDERYIPAYYEDTDLAFQVRANGYKVVYQPASVVVHFEGISNGTDLSAGMKAYQLVNKEKFFDKWKEVLSKDHFVNGQDVFVAKDRSRYRKHILVIDHYVPHFDKDAGGRCTYMWLKMFVKLGFQVTFIGDNFYKHEPYTTILNQMGIEVLYGNFYYNNYKGWLIENLHYFDYIYLQRPHISIKYIDLIKEHARGKVFYFAHDLHFLRLGREFALTGNEQTKRQAEDIKKTEMYLFDKADVVHVVGSYEQQLLQKELPDKIIRNIPLYIYEHIPTDIGKNFAERKDIIFVGGFGHPPNIDAVEWFAEEIFPAIKSAIPDIIWHIVGGKVPENIRQLDSESIVVHGFVSDEMLEELYRQCRLAVVPLRVGAGVKGKVLEAAYYQIPLVTTTIGGEGIPHEFNAFAIEDDAKKMAEMIIELYKDCGKLEAMSNEGKKLIQKYYTLKSAEEVFLQDL